MSQAVKPRVVPVEEAAAKLLSGGMKRGAAEPTTDDPFVPTPNSTRKKSMSLSEMERIAERLAEQPDAPEAISVVGSAGTIRPPTGVVQHASPAAPLAPPPAASESDVLARYGLTKEVATAFGRFIAARARLTIELQEGSVHTPVIAVLPAAYSITVITPLKLNEMTFVPRPGTLVTLRGDNGLDVKAYYPGTYAELPALGIAIMTFIRQETADGKA
jgi:hypothetical protein